jgi:hypothetical protein
MFIRGPKTFSINECYEIPIEKRIAEATEFVSRSKLEDHLDANKNQNGSDTTTQKSDAKEVFRM